MQLPVKAHYATVAMLALAAKYQTGELLQARVIASAHEIPSQFLGQILQQLRTAGLIISVRGSSGGFRLAKSPEEISIANIVEAICFNSPTDAPSAPNDAFSSVVSVVWQELSEIQLRYLEQLTLAQLVHQLTPEPAAMFFI